MARVELFYRDAGNYKCRWSAEIPDKVMEALPPPEFDGMYDIQTLGLEVTDIPLLQENGYDEGVDHPFVSIESVNGIRRDRKTI